MWQRTPHSSAPQRNMSLAYRIVQMPGPTPSFPRKSGTGAVLCNDRPLGIGYVEAPRHRGHCPRSNMCCHLVVIASAHTCSEWRIAFSVGNRPPFPHSVRATGHAVRYPERLRKVDRRRESRQLCEDLACFVVPARPGVGVAGKFPGKGGQRRLKKLATKKADPIQEPVVIVAEGCDASVKGRMAGYRQLLLDAFTDYAGTIISGGTTSGVSGIVGAVGARYRAAAYTIGYLPKRLRRRDKVDQVPSRHREIRRTDGEEYSGLDPLQPWINMLCSGIAPSDVKLLAVNGGKITALEC